MVTDVNQTYCGDHFGIYTNTQSLCCTPETNIMLYINYISKKRETSSFKDSFRETTIREILTMQTHTNKKTAQQFLTQRG